MLSTTLATHLATPPPNTSVDALVEHYNTSLSLSLDCVAPPSLSDSVTETLIHCFISTGLDYCDAILTGLPSKTLDRQYAICSDLSCQGFNWH